MGPKSEKVCELLLPLYLISKDIVVPYENVAMPFENIVIRSKNVVMPFKNIVVPSENVVLPFKNIVVPSKKFFFFAFLKNDLMSS